MARKNNRKCCNCGKEYYYCSGNCADSINKPAWMASFCSEDCMNLFNTATSYLAGSITKDQAFKVVKKADLSNIRKFNKGVVKMVDEVLSTKNENIVTKNEIEKSVDISRSTNDIKKSAKNTFVEDNKKVSEPIFKKEEKKEEKIVDKTKNKKRSSKSQVKMTSLWGNKDDK